MFQIVVSDEASRVSSDSFVPIVQCCTDRGGAYSLSLLGQMKLPISKSLLR